MHDAHPLKSLSQGVSTQLKSLLQCKFCQISKSNNNSHDRIKKKRLMNCFGRKADMFIKHFNVRKKIQLNITGNEISKCERFQCKQSAIYNQTSLAMNSRLRTKTAEQRRERERETSVIQMAWDLWILSRVHLHLKRLVLSVLVPGLVKHLSVILQRTSFLMHLHPIWLYWASRLIANRCLKYTPPPPPPRESRLGDMRSGFTRPWAFFVF